MFCNDKLLIFDDNNYRFISRTIVNQIINIILVIFQLSQYAMLLYDFFNCCELIQTI